MDIDIVEKLKELGVSEDIISDVQQQDSYGLTNTVETMLENRIGEELSQELQQLLRKSDKADLLLLIDRLTSLEDEEDIKDILE